MTNLVTDKSPSITSGMLLAGKYRVDRLLGEGGMGVVLAATNEALRQRVAIKLLRSSSLVNEKALGRFEREARAAARLRSEHVARVLDVGKLDDGRPYMVMEYLEGKDLGDVIDEGPYLSVTDTVDYVLQACEAVAEAHAAGIIHRDLKPRNLFLATTVDGRPLVKVLDFGISKDEGGGTGEDMSLTRTTEIIGSPSYMSPEQLRASKEVDVRTDIWALGVILYELLTKKVPFQAVTVTDLVAVVLMEPTPDVRLERPDVPDGLVYAINRCLAKRREERFSSIAELVGALAPYASAHLAGMADRILRVAQTSSRGLPPSDTGSGPYAHLSAAQVAMSQSNGSGTGPLAPPTVVAPPLQMPGGQGFGPHTPASMYGAPPTVGIGYGPPPALAGHAPPAAYPGHAPQAHALAHSAQAHAAQAPAAQAPYGHPGSQVPPAASSARVAVQGHGGTSVAWGETQIEPGTFAARPSRMPLVLGALAVTVLALSGTGAVLYARHARAGDATVATQPGPPVALPPGRKDLPASPSAAAADTADTAAPAPSSLPSSLPSSRVPLDEKPSPKPGAPATARPGGKPAAPATPVTPASPATPAGKPDDLSNVGRR